MNKEELIKKWVLGQLSDEELKGFEALEDSAEYKRLVDTAAHFKASGQSQVLEYDDFRKQLQPNKSGPKISWWLQIASVVVLALSIYALWFNNPNTVFTTEFAENEQIILPDKSEVILNSDSRLSYNTKSWEEQRSLQLEGEAYFSVTSGIKFTVETNAGTVTVMGTKFNVSQRNGYFEVACYEGKVRVELNNFRKILNPGERVIKILEEFTIGNMDEETPDWLEGSSKFEKVPFNMVCEELERQFDVKLNFDAIDASRRFTGTFPNKDLEKALIAITKPMNLDFTIRPNNRIVIHAENH